MCSVALRQVASSKVASSWAVRSRSQVLASQSAIHDGSIEDQTMTRTDSSWRQLRDVVGALIVKIEPAPTTAGQDQKQGKTAQSR